MTEQTNDVHDYESWPEAARALWNRRIELGLSQSEAGALASPTIHQSVVSEIENGRSHRTSVVEAYAKALGLRLGYTLSVFRANGPIEIPVFLACNAHSQPLVAVIANEAEARKIAKGKKGFIASGLYVSADYRE